MCTCMYVDGRMEGRTSPEYGAYFLNPFAIIPKPLPSSSTWIHRAFWVPISDTRTRHRVRNREVERENMIDQSQSFRASAPRVNRAKREKRVLASIRKLCFSIMSTICRGIVELWSTLPLIRFNLSRHYFSPPSQLSVYLFYLHETQISTPSNNILFLSKHVKSSSLIKTNLYSGEFNYFGSSSRVITQQSVSSN